MSGRSEDDLPVLVIGGGVSGLSTLVSLRQAGTSALLLEASDQLGGNIRTESHDGFLYDVGPDAFLKAKTAAKELIEHVGLGAELIAPRPEGSRVFVALDGILEPMPEGLALGVPSRPGPLLDSNLLSVEGKLRAFLEPFVRPRMDGAEESILEFTTRRLGSEMAERIAAPLLSGVFAGDASKLSLQAAFPQLAGLEKKYGSLFSGMNGGRSVLSVLLHPKKPAESPFLSLRRGLGSLIDALFECALSPQARSGPSLPQSPPIRLSSPVRRLLAPEAGEPAGVELSSGERLAGRHIVVAGPPWVAAALLGESQLARELSGIRGFPTATVFFGLRQAEVSSDLQGSGFIVPPGEGKILASTWVSSKWEGRAAPGTALVRAFVGGARTPELAELPDSQLLDLAQGELTRLMGSLGRPLFRRVFRYERGTPQPELGHTERLAELRRGLQVRPWLSVIGSGYGAVGIPDCIRQAREVTEGLLKGDPPGPEASGRAS